MDVEAYYTALPATRRERLQAIEAQILTISPKVVRSLKYKMPTFETPVGWIAIGNQKHHIAVYTCTTEKIAPYITAHPKTDHGKSCLRFRDSHTIDFEALGAAIRLAL